jgi:hypothetical protein
MDAEKLSNQFRKLELFGVLENLLRVCRVGDCSSGDGTFSAIDSSRGLV